MVFSVIWPDSFMFHYKGSHATKGVGCDDRTAMLMNRNTTGKKYNEKRVCVRGGGLKVYPDNVFL